MDTPETDEETNKRDDVSWAELVPADFARKLERERDSLREACKALVTHWDTPLWKDTEPTAKVINRLRELLANEKK